MQVGVAAEQIAVLVTNPGVAGAAPVLSEGEVGCSEQARTKRPPAMIAETSGRRMQNLRTTNERRVCPQARAKSCVASVSIVAIAETYIPPRPAVRYGQ